MVDSESIASISSVQARGEIFAVQHVRKLKGTTGAHLLRASDGNFYVTKFSNNPLGVRVLASEFLATKIGLSLGLPMADVTVIEVPTVLIRNSPELRIATENHGSFACAAGQNMGVRYVAGTTQERVLDHMPKALFKRVSNRADFLEVLPLDKWLGNCDGRQAIYVGKAGARRYRAIFIDQHDCFDGAKWQFPDDPIMGTHVARHVYAPVTGWDSFEPVLSKIENFEPGVLWRLASEIPGQWYGFDQTALARLIASICKRRSAVRGLITRFRKCSLQPFPNWRK